MTSISKSLLARVAAVAVLAAPAMSFAAIVTGGGNQVPEPGSLALVGLGLAAAVAIARRRK